MRSLLLVLLVAGCSDPSPGAGGDYLPLSTGATWTFKVTENLVVGTKVTTVGAIEEVGVPEKAGVLAFRVVTDKSNGEQTVSWQEDAGDRIVRHREISHDLTGTATLDETYVPSKLRIDLTPAHTALGAVWEDQYAEQVTDLLTGLTSTNNKSETWTVEAVGEQVTVPAGTFTCLRLRRSGSVIGSSDKTYWFADGVGKIKETGGQTEELESYSLP